MKGQLVVVDLYPSLLQPEGDRGNAVLLAHRARCFGVEATATVVHPGDPLPPADIVCLGGSEDADLAVAADRLRACGLVELVTDGAVVFGVGGGYALLGHELVAADGSRHEGLGLLDVVMSDTGALVSGPVLTLPAPELGPGCTDRCCRGTPISPTCCSAGPGWRWIRRAAPRTRSRPTYGAAGPPRLAPRRGDGRRPACEMGRAECASTGGGRRCRWSGRRPGAAAGESPAASPGPSPGAGQVSPGRGPLSPALSTGLLGPVGRTR